ncbi:MAG: transcriptional repressor [Chloroflexi bacterium]|nr:transcriptional repressor [Chloroflexota bacterium]
MAMADALREVGFRLTPQRMMILDVIHESTGHFSVDEVCGRVRATYPYIDISTVYRTLQLLKKLHLVTESDLGSGHTQYELRDRSLHHHLVCSGCRETYALDNSVLEPLRRTLDSQHDFEADLDHLVIFGRCSRCRARIGGARADSPEPHRGD